MTPKVSRAGDRGLLVEFGPDIAAVELRQRAAGLRVHNNVVACIVGHQSLYAILRDPAAVPTLDQMPALPVAGRTYEIDVDFRGPDLEAFLSEGNVTRSAFLSRLGQIRLTARYLGFRAGFAYLEGWPEEWRMARRLRSRNLVPHGSFAIAGAMAGFYPVDSPGGWNILGRTNTVLWDPEKEPPNRIAPGDAILLRSSAIDHFDALPERRVQPAGDVVAEVVAAGQLTTVVGAPDWKRAEYGVSPGGPFDAPAAARANRSIGNEDDAVLLECVLVAPRLRFRMGLRVAFCDGAGDLRTFDVSAGQELDIGRFRGGLRGYLAIEGGVEEMRARFGEAPHVLRKGDELSVAPSTLLMRPPSFVAGTALTRAERHAIRVIAGPHDAPSLPKEWEVTAELNRVGIRLRRRAGGGTAGGPPALHSEALHVVAAPRELPSCGMQFGTIQWHPDGSLVVMGPDHPVTGGYLQPATVVSEDLWKLAQLAPGEQIRFELME